ncbi:MAG TPA: hypothetical protein VJI46_05800 [Candidatus Nanoarchaeia archaeon]|nr:hypothetical protein [Candidatus Nanoarchaeia archaeon]
MEILSETPLALGEMKEEIDKIKKRDKELNFRAQKTDEYLQSFVEQKKRAELKKKLVALEIPRLREAHICKLVDIMPATLNDVKAVFQGQTLSLSNESLKKIVDEVKEFQ